MATSEMNCDFDAPQFVDFNDGAGADVDADKWFDGTHNDIIPTQGGQELPLTPGREEAAATAMEVTEAPAETTTAAPAAESEPMSMADLQAPAEEQSSESAPVLGKRKSNEPAEEARPAKQARFAKPAPSKSQKSAKEAPKPSHAAKASVKSAKENMVKRNATSKIPRPTTAPSRAPVTPKARAQPPRVAKSATKPTAAPMARPKSAPATARPATRVMKRELTVPTTPLFLKRAAGRTSRKIQTTEERQMEEIEKGKDEQKKLHKMNASMLKKAERGEYMPTRSVRPLTEPHGFSFKSDNRLRAKPTEPSARKPKPVAHKTAGGVTEVVPFSFNTDARRAFKGQPEPAAEPYVSVAEAVNKFNTKTPQRYRVKPANTKYVPGPAEHKPYVPTVPVSPTLATKDRLHSGPAPLTSEERELAELAKLPAFKAQPVNERVMQSSGQLGIPKVQKPTLTEPVAPVFASDERMAKRAPVEAPEEEHHEFHAHPVPATLYQAVAAAPVERKAPTVPQTPEVLKHHSVKAVAEPAPAPESFQFKANPLPDFTEVAPLPTVAARPVTAPAPFSLSTETRGARYQAQLEEKKRADEEAAALARSFRAQPIMSEATHQDALPDVPRREVTQPAPFNLAGDFHHERAREEFQRKVEAAQEEEKNNRSFHAKPNPHKNLVPFVPAKSTKALTDVVPFDLNTEARQSSRQAYEEDKARREADAGEERARQQEERKLQEAEELKAIRLQRVHKPEPVRTYKPDVIKPSQKPLTEPQSPRFATRNRTRLQESRAV